MTAQRRNAFGMIALLGAIVGITEFLVGAEVMAEVGIIHFLAVGFVGLAVARMFSKSLSSNMDHRGIARALIVSMAIFAITHAVEYLAHDVLPVSEDTEAVIIANLYMAAFFVGGLGALRLFRKVGDALPFSTLFRILLCLNVIVVLATLFPEAPFGLPADAFMARMSMVVFFATFALMVWILGFLAEQVPTLARFLGRTRVAFGVVVLSAVPEAFLAFFGEVAAIPEHRLEVIAHYLFYTGMILFFLSFDYLRSEEAGS